MQRIIGAAGLVCMQGKEPAHLEGRLVGVDLLRALAILVTVGIHWRSANLVPHDGVSEYLYRVVGHGGYGVTAFFVVSGFLICRTTMRHEGDIFRLSPSVFYVRRAARILPLLLAIIALATAAFAIGSPGDKFFRFVFNNPDTMRPAFWLSLSTVTNNWFYIVERHQEWGLQWVILWSLAVEEQFYLVFPVVVLLMRCRERLLLLLWGLVCVGNAARMIADMNGADWVVLALNSPACFDALAFGVMTALTCGRVTLSLTARRWVILAACAVMVTAYFSEGRVFAPTMLAGGVSLFIIVAVNAPLFTSPMWRPISRVGELSYGLYLLHPAVLYLLSPMLRNMGFIVGFMVFFVVTAVVAEASYRYFEQPANRLIRNLLARRSPAPAMI